MKSRLVSILMTAFFLGLSQISAAQCSLCTKTAQQLGEKPALGMNQGILYLMFTPLLIMGVIAYRWWKSNREDNSEVS